MMRVLLLPPASAVSRFHATHSADGRLLGDALLANGRDDEAVDAFARLVRQEDLDEGAHRSLMTARARSGDRAGAMREYLRLETTLRRELEAAPERASADLFHRIQRGELV